MWHYSTRQNKSIAQTRPGSVSGASLQFENKRFNHENSFFCKRALRMKPAPRINLRHLRVFIAVAEFGSVSKAADSLYRAQSAVSRSIQELETLLGVDLFERKSSGMLPTVFGQTLLYRARRAAQEFKLARDEMASRIRKANGSLNAPVFGMLFNESRLQAFVALAESHHMPTVANLLRITQPAVSASITELESSLGIPLFTRTAKGMLVNESGKILVLRTKRALAELRHVEADIAALHGKTQGMVTVGAHPLSRTVILPRAIARVLAAHPQVCISTVEGRTEDLAAGLRTGDLDFVLGTLRPGQCSSDLVDMPLLTDKMSVFVRTGHPLTRLPKISIDDLMKAQWILPASRTPTRELFDLSFTHMSGTLPKSPIETSDLSILRGMLMNSDLITALSPQQLDFELKLGVLQVLDFEFEKSARVIGLIRRAKSHPSPGAAALVAAIQQVVDEMRSAAPA
ncbi:MAG: LysR family transcriptional regulator [Herminiimonas sp.]|nr:LysR family transcriptional regulator [Herminiimonas sp.]